MVFSRGILGLGDLGSCSLDEESEGVGLVTTGEDEGTTGGNEGATVVRDDEGGGGGATDGEESGRSTMGQGGMPSCLFTRDFQVLSANDPESLPVLDGRFGGSPEFIRSLN